MTTKVTSDKQGNETLDALLLQWMRVREAVGQYSHILVVVLTVLVYSFCEEPLRLLWTMKLLHPGIALLCIISLVIGRNSR